MEHNASETCLTTEIDVVNLSHDFREDSSKETILINSIKYPNAKGYSGIIHGNTLLE